MKHLIFTFFAIVLVITLRAQVIIEVPTTQKTMVTKHTATWCPFCGTDASWDLQQYFADSLDNKNAVVLSAHRSTTSKLYSKAGKDLLDQFQGVVYQPEFFFNTTKVDGSEPTIKSTIESFVKQWFIRQPAVQTGLRATYNPTTDSLTVATRSKFFQNVQGEYRLAIIIVEKEVVAEQASRTNTEVHKRVVRATMTPDITGTQLINGNVTANTEFTRSFSMKWNNVYKLDNVEFIALIWKKNVTNNKWEFVNINEVTQVQQITTSTKAIDFLEQRFTVSPNPVKETTQIRLDLPKNYNNAEILLINAQGVVVKNIYRGTLNNGEQTIALDRNELSSGLYFVRLHADGQTATRKLLLY